MKDFWRDLIDDKTMVIISLLVIAIAAMIKLEDPSVLVSPIISGLLGIAVGKRMS